MELNDSVLMRQQGARLMKPLPRQAGLPLEFEEVVVETLDKLDIGVEYKTPRHNILLRQSTLLFSLCGPDGADPVMIDTSGDNDTQAVIEHAIQAGAGAPPADPKAVYRVSITVATPQLTNAVRRAGQPTSDTEIVLEVHPEWAPLAAARFRLLVEQQYFVGTRFYCIVPDFVLQFGLPANPSASMPWRKLPLADDPPKERNSPGRVAFVSHGPNSRTAEFFVNLGDNSTPGPYTPESFDKQGITPFAEVVGGVGALASAITPEYGTEPDLRLIRQYGNPFLEANFPNLTFVRRCRFQQSIRGQPVQHTAQTVRVPEEVPPVVTTRTHTAVRMLEHTAVDSSAEQAEPEQLQSELQSEPELEPELEPESCELDDLDDLVELNALAQLDDLPAS